jgi:hypothetical protein
MKEEEGYDRRRRKGRKCSRPSLGKRWIYGDERRMSEGG